VNVAACIITVKMKRSHAVEGSIGVLCTVFRDGENVIMWDVGNYLCERLYRICTGIVKGLSVVDYTTTIPPVSVNRQSVVVCRRGASPQAPLHRTQTPALVPSEQRTSIAMQIDMSLATSYKPVIMCAVKVCALMVFHYTSIPVLFVTERYALIMAFLYVDTWLDQEYIVNTNGCVAIIAGSLLVHELRDAGIQERIHGEVAHNIVLSILVGSNALLLVFGEHG
jgi:hypothetical protein